MRYTYEELCPLQNANQGDLYLVRETQTGLLAVKRTVDISLFQLYKRLQGINHVNLMRILDVGIEQEKCVVIAEYITGETIAEHLRKQGRFSEKSVENYVMMLCDGVQTLHNHQIIHRDISPNNVMLTTDGILKLCDYDISKIYDKDQLRDEQLRGTYGYAAPEQFGYALTDEQSDIYAIGMLAYTMLGGNGNKLKCRSGRLRRAVYRAISMDKTDRYTNAYQMKEEIVMSSSKPEGRNRTWIQYIPGFRTLTPWQMVVALIAYPCLLYVDIMVLDDCLRNVFTYLLFIVVPWFFYLDLFHISKVLLKLEPGQQWFRLVVGIAIQMLGYFWLKEW